MNQPAPGSGDTGPTTDEDPRMPSTPRLIGTRTCLGCGQELAGQPISRTAVEDLPFVRCSECGRTTPVLEYPVMSRWSGTLGAGLLTQVAAPAGSPRLVVSSWRAAVAAAGMPVRVVASGSDAVGGAVL